VQGGQLADLAARRLVLQHLSDAVPKRTTAIKTELQELVQNAQELAEAMEKSEDKVHAIEKRQKELEEQHHAITIALKTHTELRELDDVAMSTLPQLWSRFHELQQALRLFCAASAPSSAAAESSMLDVAGIHQGRLALVERLQRNWTKATGDRLRLQTAEAEMAVASAAKISSFRGQLGGI